jgi:hypothetical protein
MATTARLTTALLTLLSLQTAHTADLDEFCCLCTSCSYPGARADIFLNDGGLSCAKLDAVMFNPANHRPGTSSCIQQQNSYRDVCCNPSSTFQSVPQKATIAPGPPVVNMPQGNEPHCDLCFNKNYPTKPYTITTVAYVPGNPTCMDLYWMGKTGNVPGAICYPLQLYMQGPCGCNEPPKPAPVPAPPVPVPTLPVPAPAPAVPGRKDAPQTTKTDLKLATGRDRGTTNKRRLLLKGTSAESTRDKSLEAVMMEIAEEIVADIPSV